MYIINAPWVFRGVWALIKTFLDKQTQKRINILGGNGQKEIFKEIDKKNLLEDTGGFSKEPLWEEPGPWKQETKDSWKEERITFKNNN